MLRFIDTHSHGLFGVDDGIQDFEGTKRFLQIAVTHQTKLLFFTPHYVSEGNYCTPFSELVRRMKDIRHYIIEHALPIEVRLGSEIYLNEAGLEHIQRSSHWAYENTHYVLIESVPPYDLTLIDQALEELKKQGQIAIIAHPERYFQDKQSCLITVKRWIEKGAFCSVNRTSFISNTRPWVQFNVFALLNAGFIHLVASDAHHAPGRREPRLDDIHQLLCRWGSKRLADQLCILNPQCLADDRPLQPVNLPRNALIKAWAISNQNRFIQDQRDQQKQG